LTTLLSRRAVLLLSIPVLVILLGYVLYPTLQTFYLGLDVDLYRSFFSSWRSANVRGLGNSVYVSILTVAIGGFLGTTLAYVFYRFDFPLKDILVSFAAIPLALPPLVGVLAFLFLYGESGILPRSLQAVFGLDAVPFAFEGISAVLFVHVYSMYVYFYLFVSAGLRSLDAGTVEASSDLGASHIYSFAKIIVPHLRPSIAGASILVFMISMASFTAPLLFAGTEHFMTLQIYNYKLNGDLAMSATVSTVLTLISLGFLAILEIRSARSTGGGGSKGASAQTQTVGRGWARSAAGLGAAAFILFLMLPIATVVLISFAQEGSWTWQLLPESYTLDNYVSLFTDPDVLDPVLNSIFMATVASSANLVFGVAAAFLIIHRDMPFRYLIRILTALPFAIPGTVIAVNLIVTFNEPSPLSFGNVLVGSFWILPLAYFIRHIPLVVRATVAALERYDPRLSEASSDLGAGAVTTVRRVVGPAIAPAVIAGALLTFVTALGEFVSSIMLYVFDNRPISVEILSQLRIYDFGAAAAYSVFLIILIVGATVAVRRIGGSPNVAL
jgi:iron(III) transport system permease protein